MKVNISDISGLIDHTLLKPTATNKDIEKLCNEAAEFGFFSVCVQPYFIKLAKEFLEGGNVKVAAVVGFPFGMTSAGAKAFEAMNATSLGADEIDFVINIGAAKSGDWDVVRRDISGVIGASKGVVHKTIIETCYLDEEEIARVVKIALDAGSEFIKTSTGYGPYGARVKDVRLIKSIVGERAGVKASGGIRTIRQVLNLLKAGATRIGTSSGVRIIEEVRRTV
ncbi:MAG: deoxyribose-phosphate aldolase [Nitrospirota bacterium]